MNKHEVQRVLLCTDHHDVDSEPDEQWLLMPIAGAFLLSQWLPDKPPSKEAGTYLISEQEYEQLKELLWRLCTVLGWSKWDYRSEWYVKEVLPVGEQPPETPPPSMEKLEDVEKRLNVSEGGIQGCRCQSTDPPEARRV